jgi:hypothetical protein
MDISCNKQNDDHILRNEQITAINIQSIDETQIQLTNENQSTNEVSTTGETLLAKLANEVSTTSEALLANEVSTTNENKIQLMSGSDFMSKIESIDLNAVDFTTLDLDYLDFDAMEFDGNILIVPIKTNTVNPVAVINADNSIDDINTSYTINASYITGANNLNDTNDVNNEIDENDDIDDNNENDNIDDNNENNKNDENDEIDENDNIDDNNENNKNDENDEIDDNNENNKNDENDEKNDIDENDDKCDGKNIFSKNKISKGFGKKRNKLKRTISRMNIFKFLVFEVKLFTKSIPTDLLYDFPMWLWKYNKSENIWIVINVKNTEVEYLRLHRDVIDISPI